MHVHVLSYAKNYFGGAGSVLFSDGRKLEGLLGKNGTLTNQVCFSCQTSFNLTESA